MSNRCNSEGEGQTRSLSFPSLPLTSRHVQVREVKHSNVYVICFYIKPTILDLEIWRSKTEQLLLTILESRLETGFPRQHHYLKYTIQSTKLYGMNFSPSRVGIYVHKVCPHYYSQNLRVLIMSLRWISTLMKSQSFFLLIIKMISPWEIFWRLLWQDILHDFHRAWHVWATSTCMKWVE